MLPDRVVSGTDLALVFSLYNPLDESIPLQVLRQLPDGLLHLPLRYRVQVCRPPLQVLLPHRILLKRLPLQILPLPLQVLLQWVLDQQLLLQQRQLQAREEELLRQVDAKFLQMIKDQEEGAAGAPGHRRVEAPLPGWLQSGL